MIKDLKELEKLLKICRKQGVSDIKWGDIELKLGDLPSNDSVTIDVNEGAYTDFPSGMLTAEQLAFYSAGGAPEDDPMNEVANQ